MLKTSQQSLREIGKHPHPSQPQFAKSKAILSFSYILQNWYYIATENKSVWIGHKSSKSPLIKRVFFMVSPNFILSQHVSCKSCSIQPIVDQNYSNHLMLETWRDMKSYINIFSRKVKVTCIALKLIMIYRTKPLVCLRKGQF